MTEPDRPVKPPLSERFTSRDLRNWIGGALVLVILLLCALTGRHCAIRQSRKVLDRGTTTRSDRLPR